MTGYQHFNYKVRKKLFLLDKLTNVPACVKGPDHFTLGEYGYVLPLSQKFFVTRNFIYTKNLYQNVL
jgi:hypothetical protein